MNSYPQDIEAMITKAIEARLSSIVQGLVLQRDELSARLKATFAHRLRRPGPFDNAQVTAHRQHIEMIDTVIKAIQE